MNHTSFLEWFNLEIYDIKPYETISKPKFGKGCVYLSDTLKISNYIKLAPQWASLTLRGLLRARRRFARSYSLCSGGPILRYTLRSGGPILPYSLSSGVGHTHTHTHCVLYRRFIKDGMPTHLGGKNLNSSTFLKNWILQPFRKKIFKLCQFFSYYVSSLISLTFNLKYFYKFWKSRKDWDAIKTRPFCHTYQVSRTQFFKFIRG